MKNVFLFFLLLIQIFSSNVYSQESNSKLKFIGCNNSIEKNNLNLDFSKIDKIEVDIHKYRNWTVNGIKILTNRSRFVTEEFKRRFDATIVVNYDNGAKCIFPARVRHSGDEKDHIALFNNHIIQSLDVSLEYGNIKGITKFKLLKPDTRGVLEDVLVQTQILRNFGYLAPRSIKVNARVNQTNSVMLFQEKSSKELLEYNNRREGPILESDEKYFYKIVESIPDNNLSNWSHNTPFLRTKSSKAMLTKSTNPRLVYRGDRHKEISIKAVSDLNLIYLYWSNRLQDEKNNYFYFDYDLDNTLLGFFSKDKIIKLDVYNLLMLSTNSQHALSVNNRKFYWNSIDNYFEPINYDANPAIDRDTPTTTSASQRFPVSKYLKESFAILENKLREIDLENLHFQLKLSGTELTKADLNKKLIKILNNLEKVKTNYFTNVSYEKVEHNYFKSIDNILFSFNKTVNEIDPNSILIKYNKNQQSFEECSDLFEKCSQALFNDEELSSLLEGELKIDNANHQFVGTNFEIEKKFKNSNKRFEIKKLDNSEIYFENGIDLQIDHENKLINIEQKISGSRVYIIGGSLQNFTINFYGKDIIDWENDYNLKEFPKNFPIDNKTLTGCLSLINLNVKNITINAKNSSCEDTINFINSRGQVQNISIENSFSDALDIDFSKIDFNSIEVKNAINDCTDFSAGNYSIKKLNLLNCGDKGLSIGEKSIITLDKIFVTNSNIGIATKDSSYLNLDFAKMSQLKTCVSAYNKKQEFMGGYIEIKKMECEKYLRLADLDNLSRISLDNKPLVNFTYGQHYDPLSLKVSKVKGKNIVGNLLKDYKAINKDGSVNTIVEISHGLDEKWEVSKLNGSLSREFYMGSPRTIKYKPYPVNYGMIPQTILPISRGGDGDPLDVLILGKKLAQGEIVQVKPLGVMKMTDGGEQDDKIISVPVTSPLNKYNNIEHLNSEQPEILENIKLWFLNYKGQNTVKFLNFESDKVANQLIKLTTNYYKRFGMKERS